MANGCCEIDDVLVAENIFLSAGPFTINSEKWASDETKTIICMDPLLDHRRLIISMSTSITNNTEKILVISGVLNGKRIGDDPNCKQFPEEGKESINNVTIEPKTTQLAQFSWDKFDGPFNGCCRYEIRTRHYAVAYDPLTCESEDREINSVNSDFPEYPGEDQATLVDEISFVINKFEGLVEIYNYNVCILDGADFLYHYLNPGRVINNTKEDIGFGVSVTYKNLRNSDGLENWVYPAAEAALIPAGKDHKFSKYKIQTLTFPEFSRFNVVIDIIMQRDPLDPSLKECCLTGDVKIAPQQSKITV